MESLIIHNTLMQKKSIYYNRELFTKSPLLSNSPGFYKRITSKNKPILADNTKKSYIIKYFILPPRTQQPASSVRASSNRKTGLPFCFEKGSNKNENQIKKIYKKNPITSVNSSILAPGPNFINSSIPYLIWSIKYFCL